MSKYFQLEKVIIAGKLKKKILKNARNCIVLPKEFGFMEFCRHQPFLI